MKTAKYCTLESFVLPAAFLARETRDYRLDKDCQVMSGITFSMIPNDNFIEGEQVSHCVALS